MVTLSDILISLLGTVLNGKTLKRLTVFYFLPSFEMITKNIPSLFNYHFYEGTFSVYTLVYGGSERSSRGTRGKTSVVSTIQTSLSMVCYP
jgi:hypothetical protein